MLAKFARPTPEQREARDERKMRHRRPDVNRSVRRAMLSNATKSGVVESNNDELLAVVKAMPVMNRAW